MKNLLFIAISILAVGCGGKDESTTETKPVEEKVVEVNEEGKAEETVAESKPFEEVPLNPNLRYVFKDEVTIIGCDKKASGALTIPATIKGKPVTSIGEGAFSMCSALTSISIPDRVTSIGERAFLGCKSLTGIIIPDGVTSIGDGAFSWCPSLTTIEVGEGNVNFTEVNGVLFNAEKTVLLTYPASKTGANYTIPDGVTSIGISAFTTCFSLTSITIPDSVTSIGVQAFMDCRSLTGITIPDGVTSIGAKAFQSCESLTSITIPDSVTSIGVHAFWFCESLTSITIPDSVTSIGEEAFSDCNSLTAVTFLGDAPKVGENAFNNATPTIYRNPETKGWGDTFAGRPVKLISEKPEEPVAESKQIEEKQQEVKEEAKPEDSVAETKPELEGVNYEKLEKREGIYYLLDSDTPYTGKSFRSYSNGQRSEVNWKDGKENGLYVSWYVGGQKKAERTYKDGRWDGLWVFWHSNGKKGTEANYKEGKLDGLVVNWHFNGQKFSEENYKDGELISEKFWNNKGEPVDTYEEAE